MRIKLLGASAGGGFPQWNCACPNCSGARDERKSGGSRRRFQERTQSQLAVSADDRAWFLLNASPDLRFQIESFSELHPKSQAGGTRHTPIAAVVLTNADLDHVLGLLLMRESQPIHIYATASVRKILTEDNTMYRMLDQKHGQVKWTDILPGQSFELVSVQGERSGLHCLPLSIDSKYPIYVSPQALPRLDPQEAVLGLVIREGEGSRQKQFAHLPGIRELDENWRKRISECDLVFCDGTFWEDDELKKASGAARTSREMGHIPMSGPAGSIEVLSRLKRPRKVFTHINNTNPVLDETGEEHAAVLKAGIEVGKDGMEFKL